MQKILSKKVRASVVALALAASIFSAPTAEALYKVIPATQWGHIYAGTSTLTKLLTLTMFFKGRFKPFRIHSKEIMVNSIDMNHWDLFTIEFF